MSSKDNGTESLKPPLPPAKFLAIVQEVEQEARELRETYELLRSLEGAVPNVANQRMLRPSLNRLHKFAVAAAEAVRELRIADTERRLDAEVSGNRQGNALPK